mmetsp:Transcript_40367/g.85268  ORF Transcript_40367/g.85268 Transcript_40367/m.85268 type:complete len:180 (-) Transcript_40367:27-566(-)
MGASLSNCSPTKIRQGSWEDFFDFQLDQWCSLEASVAEEADEGSPAHRMLHHRKQMVQSYFEGYVDGEGDQFTLVNAFMQHEESSIHIRDAMTQFCTRIAHDFPRHEDPNRSDSFIEASASRYPQAASHHESDEEGEEAFSDTGVVSARVKDMLQTEFANLQSRSAEVQKMLDHLQRKG